MRVENRRMPIVSLGLVVAVLLGACSSDGDAELSCEEVEAREEVELLLCDDGETRIDRTDELAPLTPEAEAARSSTHEAVPTPVTPTVAETQAGEGHCSNVELDPTTQECHEGPTPAGGAYSVGTYLDDDLSPTTPEEASKLSIVEYDADGQELHRTLGDLGS